MRILVVFYSYEGNTKFIAQSIAEAVDGDILELKRKTERKSRGVLKYFWGGREVFMRKTPELFQFDKNPEDYDLIFIGTPVWSWNFAPPLRTFFKKVKLRGKKIALFCCHAGGKGKIFDKLKSQLKDNEFVGEIDFKEPLKHNPDEAKAKAMEWARKIVNNATGGIK
ncbi:flavodoxin [bacterium]|nr:MAG: flavodoxin [bacterium]